MIPSTGSRKRANRTVISSPESSPEGLLSSHNQSPASTDAHHQPSPVPSRIQRVSGPVISTPEGLQASTASPLSPASEVKAFQDMPVPVEHLGFVDDSDEDTDPLAQWQFSPEIRKVKSPQRVGKPMSLSALKEHALKQQKQYQDQDDHSSESSQEIEISHRKPTHGVGKTLAALEELRKKNEVSQEISHHGVGKQLSLSALKKLLKQQSSSSQHDDHSSEASIHDRELLQQDNDPGKAEMDSEPEITPEEQESEKLTHMCFLLREAEKRTSEALKLLSEVNPRSLDKTTIEFEMSAATINLKRASTLAHPTKRFLL